MQNDQSTRKSQAIVLYFNTGQPRPLFIYFPFSHQVESNSGRTGLSWPLYPLDHHHGPSFCTFSCSSKNKISTKFQFHFINFFCESFNRVSTKIGMKYRTLTNTKNNWKYFKLKFMSLVFSRQRAKFCQKNSKVLWLSGEPSNRGHGFIPCSLQTVFL